MSRSKVVMIVLAIALLTSALAACSAEPTTVKIAVSVPAEPAETLLIPAMEMALDEHNRTAGGAKVELLILDSASEDNIFSPEKEGEVVWQAVNDPQVVAYIGPVSTAQSKISMPILNEAGIAQITINASWPGLTKPGYGPGEPGIYYPTGKRHFFRSSMTDDILGRAAAIATQELGFQSIYIVHDGSQYSLGNTGIYELAAGDLGLEIVAKETIEFTEAAMTEQSLKIAEMQPEMVYFILASALPAAKFMAIVRQNNPGISIMGPDLGGVLLEDYHTLGLEPSLIEGIYSITSMVPPDAPDTEAGQEFIIKYEDRYDTAVPYNSSPILYEMVNVVLRAIEAAEAPTREEVLKALSEMSDYSGVLGTWNWDDQGDLNILLAHVAQYHEGKLELVQIIRR